MHSIVIISAFIIIYTYIIYPILLDFFVKKNKNDFSYFNNSNVTISIIIPAFNEIKIIDEKIKNTLQIAANYNCQIILVSNGSNDGTELYHHDKILHLKNAERKGKADAINNAMKFATGNLVLLTDANALLNIDALDNLLKQITNEKVGAVCGKKQFNSSNAEAYIESIYWDFESNLKEKESNFNSVIGAVGEIFLIKKELIPIIPSYIILDDFYLSMQLEKNGYTIKYCKNAIASENPTLNLKDEYQRRSRIASGIMQWLFKFGLKDFDKYSANSKWQFFSHRFCRWILAPFSFLFLLISSFSLCHSIFSIYSISILVFLFAIIGYFLQLKKIYIKVFHFPFYLVFVHICFAIGYIKYFMNLHTILWEKAKR